MGKDPMLARAAAPSRTASPFVAADAPPLPAAKFGNPDVTADGATRAHVTLHALETLWFNTGTLCNLACANCYIESTPRNDALVYLSAAEVATYLDEVAALRLPTRTIGFTGGEPFLNRELPAMAADALGRGHHVLVLTNAMRPMRRYEGELLDLHRRHGGRLELRVSLDHYTAAIHEAERGAGTWPIACDGLAWLARHGFRIAVAGRHLAGESERHARAGYAKLFADLGVALDVADPAALVLFPEMDPVADIPEITDACWSLLGLDPRSIMCATSRMVEKRKGEGAAHVVACTLIPYDPGFAMGTTLTGAGTRVALNHPNCARFCVLGGASCSR